MDDLRTLCRTLREKLDRNEHSLSEQERNLLSASERNVRELKAADDPEAGGIHEQLLLAQEQLIQKSRILQEMEAENHRLMKLVAEKVL